MKIHRALFASLVALSLVCSPTLRAQSEPAQAPAAAGLLGPAFESRAAGIALRPPAGTKSIRGALGTQEVVRFVHEPNRWVVKLSRILLEADKPLPLTRWKDKDGIERPGMLEWTTEQFKNEVPGAQVLREDIVRLPQADVGMMAARYNFAVETNLIQQALIRASDLQYYLLSMTSPAPREGELDQDPGVRLAVETFTQMLDSVQLLDQFELELERAERLMRTKLLYVNLTEGRLRQSLQKEQWMRILQDGKDIGYTYVIEEVARDLPRKGRIELQTGPEGVLVGIRSRIAGESGAQTDRETWLFSTFDRKYEAFSTLSYQQDPAGGKMTSGEVGVSRQRERPVAVAAPELGAPREPQLAEEYRLEVTKLGLNVSSEPIIRDLPPYYVPQAIGHLLPRLVPIREPRTYLFATWVSEAGQIMYRYVDVMAEQQVVLANRPMRAVPIKDRIGLEGPLTTHYLSPDGSYLGSVSEETKITILASDPQTIARLWRDANLTRPDDLDQGR